MRNVTGIACAITCLVELIAPASAQDFPIKPIRMIVPFPAGGPADLVARVVSQKAADILKQPILIDNRGGAGGVVGMDTVAKAEPDGYTLGLASAGSLSISVSLQEKLPYDPVKDFAPVTLAAKNPEMLVAATSVPAKTMADLIALAKAKPGEINFASSGPGSMPHLAGEMLKMTAGINIVHVPYRGAAPAVNDLLGQQVQIMFADIPVLLPHVQSGKLVALALGGKARMAVVPNVPTTAEAGLPQIDAENWYGFVAPPATPQPIIAKLNAAMVAAIRSPEVSEKLTSQGAVLVGDTPAEFAAYIKSETAKWSKVVEAAGIKPN